MVVYQNKLTKPIELKWHRERKCARVLVESIRSWARVCICMRACNRIKKAIGYERRKKRYLNPNKSTN